MFVSLIKILLLVPKAIGKYCGTERDPCMYLKCETPRVANGVDNVCEDYHPAMEGSRCPLGKLCFNGECSVRK